MAKISKQAVKELVKRYAKISITDDAVGEMTKMLESEAKRISSFAVSNAKKEKRDKITKKDIMDYVLKNSSKWRS
jgi:histone H3/H4